MKIEFVSDNADCPYIRFFAFDALEVRNLRELFVKLTEGESDRASLDELEDLETDNIGSVILRVGAWDRGLRALNGGNRFEWVLSIDSWKRLADVTDAFSYDLESSRTECLDKSGEVAVMLSTE